MKTHFRDLLSRLGASTHLPTLPHILLKLIQACNIEPYEPGTISQIISIDPSLSAGVMRLVNSDAYAPPNRVSSIHQAVLLLDRNTIKNLATSVSVHQVFSQTGNRSVVYALKQFWRHSLTCATLAQMISQKTFYPAPDEAFLSGLLHDIGKLVLWESLSEKDSPDPLLPSETASGTTHYEVGAWMIRQWKVQSFMADAVRYHHEPVHRILDALPLVKIVFVANSLCSESVQDTDAKFKAAKEIFGFSRSAAEELVLLAQKEVNQVADSLGIAFGPPGTPSISEKDMGKQQELVRVVRQISLLQGTIQNVLEADHEESILEVVMQGLKVLFDVHSIFFFMYDREKDVLAGKHGQQSGQDALMQEFVIPVRRQTSLLAQSLSRGTPLDSFGHLAEADLSIADNQIIRLMEKDGMLCLPMIAHKRFVGVIVLGVDETQFFSLCEEINILKIFTNQAALAIDAENVQKTSAASVQADGLTTSSAVARKVVHEVSNPLGIIKNYLKILGLKLAKDSPAQEEIKIINEEIDRVSGIMRELSEVSKPGVQHKEPVDINALISDLVKITQESLLAQSGIKAHLNLQPSLPSVMTDKNGLKQVFINLIKNAVEAMPDGGNIYIDTRRASDGSGNEVGEDQAADQQYIETTIRDDGSGIPDNIKSRLFEPFLTSKGREHAGLGLSISYEIVRELNGTLSCETEPKMGTTFKVVLPTGT
jgi:putative nucleotidyltransferase with HDIG domain